MATDHWWLGTTSDDHNVAANWSTAGSGGAPGESVPGAGDEIEFDGGFEGNGDNPCTLTASLSVTAIITTANYSSKIDMATFDLTVSGFITMDHMGEFDQGTGNLSVGSNVDIANVTTWTAASGTLTAIGAGAANWNIGAGITVGDLVIEKSVGGTLLFSGEWTAASFSHNSGLISLNGQTMETIGNFTIAPGALVFASGTAWNGVALTVGGEFVVSGVNGTLLNLRASGVDDWTLALTKSGRAAFVNVDYSTVSGAVVTATHTADTTNNSNWVFRTTAAPAGFGTQAKTIPSSFCGYQASR